MRLPSRAPLTAPSFGVEAKYHTEPKLSPGGRVRPEGRVRTGTPPVGSVDFDVAVGAAIPRGRAHILPVPETLVQIEPAWRGFLYFIVRDDVVVVDPRDMRIVAVVPA